jgi:MSHA biogenesis protein MshJ
MSQHPLKRWWAARSTRERTLALAAGLVALIAAVDTALLSPQRSKQAALVKQLQTAKTQLAQMQRLAQEQSQENNTQLRNRADALAARRAKAEQVIKDAQVDLIAPQDMNRQLSAILSRFPELRLVGMTSAAPASLADTGTGGGSDGKLHAAQGLYQHALDLKIEGRYLDLIADLQALEKAPYRIYWRELDLQVSPHGMPVTRVSIYTLSREPVWLKL